MIAFDHSVRVVVNGFAWSSQLASGSVFFAENQMRVTLAALQGNSNGNLSQRAASQRIGTAESLRTKQNVNAERTTLTNQAVHQQRGLGRDAVFRSKELLKLVNQQQQARHFLVRKLFAERRNILHASHAEQFTAFLQNFVQPFQNAESELAIAFNRHDSSMRQFVGGVGSKLHTLLKVDQIKLNFIRTIMQGEIRNQNVQQRRLAGTRFTSDQNVLAGSSTKTHKLKSRRASAANREVDSVCRTGCPDRI